MELGLSEAEFWSQTFYESGLLVERWRMMQAREDRRAAFAGWILANVHRDPESKSEPFRFSEVIAWLGHGFQPPEVAAEAAPPTAEALLERAKLLTEVYGGTTSNGTEA